MIGFAMSFRATTWVAELGFMRSFSIYAAVLGGIALLLPVMYLYGKRIRHWTAGTVKSKDVASEKQGSYMEY
jgi:hypothetical protein